MLASTLSRRALIPTFYTRTLPTLPTRTLVTRPNPSATSSDNTPSPSSHHPSHPTRDRVLNSEPSHDAGGATGHAKEWAGMAKNAAETASENVSDATKGLKVRVSGLWNSVVGKGKEVVNEAQDAAGRSGGEVREAAQSGVSRAKWASEEVKRSTDTDPAESLKRTTTKPEGVYRDKAFR
ncbi:hypothetical protein HDV00_011217 [Rhizophlyctis rosea]|nr:hypothetical protein HDV00_011217 [Rhizophlyctis rosea]